MPDIFMNKEKRYSEGGQDWIESYYEIYVQKLHKGLQKYCLKHTNQHLTSDYKAASRDAVNVPLV